MSREESMAQFYRRRPWLAGEEYLAEPLPKWRYDELMRRFADLERISKSHASAAAYWHRQTERARMAEVDRTKYISALESEVSA